MAKIPLRAYNREIESYIEQGRTDEAIAHCRHILKFYAKHLDTYRLLGKAFLEGQRYGEAADILQRVLSAVPDDFISQIGMSIIREDEGNLDAAIFHMERAHEIQPSNSAIQEELRRLYGRRDGVEPPKVRLTRGALVRLYARGDLYPQAIAEIRAALAENPNRVDLEVILARMYYLTSQKVEAAEVCSRLVSKLPYCFEANRILSDVLPGTSRADDAHIYQQRVYALDPYLEHVTPSTPLATDVVDHAIVLDHLEYDAAAAEAQAPEWAQTLGVDWTETEEQVPEWMAGKDTQAVPTEKTTETPEMPPSEEPWDDKDSSEGEPAIPDFMATAGWMVSDGEDQPPDEGSDIDEMEDDIAPAEIPDWLQSMAPELEADPSGEDEEATRWLESILPTESEEGEQVGVSEFELPEGLTSLESLFTEESPEPDLTSSQPEEEEGSSTPLAIPPEFISDIIEEGQEKGSDNGTLPDWLNGLEIENTAESTQVDNALGSEWLTGAKSPDEEATESEPDWLARLTSDEDEAGEFKVDETEPSDDELPEWLREPNLSESPGTEEAFEPGLTAEETSDSEADSEFVAIQPETFSSDGAKPQTEEELPALEDLDATMAWLENLAAKQGADEATLTTSPDERSDTPPDWIASLQPDSETDALAEETTFEPSESIEGHEQSNEDDETEEFAEPTSAVTPTEMDTSTEDQASVSEEVSVSPLEEAESDETFAWLESLAAHQDAADGTLFTDAEDRPETAPGWIAEIEKTDEESEPEPAAAEEMPEWLSAALSEEQAAPTGTSIDGSAWVTESEIQPVDEVEEVEEVREESTNTEEVPDKVVVEPPEESFAISSPEGPEVAVSESEEDIPEWLQELVDEDLSAELVEAKALDEMPAWLEKIDGSKPVEESAAESEPEVEVVEPESDFTEIAAETTVDQEIPDMNLSPAGDWISILEQAQADLAKEQVDSAMARYATLIQSGNCLDETVQDLREALYRYPVDVSLWQMLGDAYARNNMLQDALDAYTKAEELLR